MGLLDYFVGPYVYNVTKSECPCLAPKVLKVLNRPVSYYRLSYPTLTCPNNICAEKYNRYVKHYQQGNNLVQ